MIEVQFIKLDQDAITPTQAYPGDAGWDLHVLEDTFINPGEWRDVKSGIAIALPEGYYARLVGRSSALRKRGLAVMEGIIDAGFRGELFACAYAIPSAVEIMRTQAPFYTKERGLVALEAGSSICQVIIQEVRPVQFTEVGVLPESARGVNGFGSSGR